MRLRAAYAEAAARAANKQYSQGECEDKECWDVRPSRLVVGVGLKVVNLFVAVAVASSVRQMVSVVPHVREMICSKRVNKYS